MNPLPSTTPSENNDMPAAPYNLENLIAEQGQILEKISTGAGLKEILHAIVLWAQNESRDEMLASILLLDKEGKHLLEGAAPSLPAEYNRAIHGVAIGPGVGSCGTAAFSKKPVIVTDIEKDPLWQNFREIALSHGLRACWSTPLIGKTGQVLGTFAMYYKNPRTPSQHDLHVIRLISSTAVLAIEWKSAEAQRQQLMASEKKAYERIKEERQNFYEVLMHAPALVAVLRGPEHVFELANDMYLQVVGPTRQIVGKPIREALPELVGQGLYELLDNVYNSRKAFYGDEVPVRIDKGEGRLQDFFFNFVYQPIIDDEGKAEGIFVHAVDVTALVHAKNRAEKSEELFRNYVSNAPTPIGIYIGREMRIQTANDAILEAWEKDRSVVGKTFREALPELEGQPFYQLLDRVFTTGVSYEARHERVDLLREGKLTPTWWNFTYKALRDENNKIFGVINTAAEVTDLVTARQSLTQAQETLRSAIDIAELGTWTVDAKTRFSTYSEPVARWFGVPPQGGNVDELINTVHESDRAAVIQSIERAIAKGEPFEAEFRVVHPADKRERILHGKGKVVKDEKGVVLAINGVCRDITLQKEIENELGRQVEKRTIELQQANEELNIVNENLKQFVYIASHDLQEPLRKINMFADMLRKRSGTELDDMSRIFLEKITQASQRMATLIRDLLDFSRAESGEKRFAPTDLNTVLQNVVDDYDVLIQQTNAIVNIQHLPVIDAIPLQMNQLFYNLLGNALKFSRPGIPPVITVTCRDVPQEELRQLRPSADGAWIEIVVSDNGIGFDQQFAEQIFVIFQRLHAKEKFEGTGIGLALCKKIVDNHGGVIFAHAKENEGAAFHIFLPLE